MKNNGHLDSTLVTSRFPKLKTCVELLPKHGKQCPHMLLGWHFVLVIFHGSHQFLMRDISLFLGSLGEPLEGSWIGFYLLLATSLWALNPFFPRNEGQPILGSVHPKISKGKEMRE
jgi:hypothetical protein